MRSTKRYLTALIALLSLFWGQLPAANAAPGLPSSGGETKPYILEIPATQLAALDKTITDLGISIDQKYSLAIKGFALSLNQSQKDYLAHYFPNMVVSPDATVNVADVQDPANWDISTLDQPGAAPDTKYRYPVQAGSGVKVYIIDTGISANASQLGSRLLPGKDFTGGNDPSDCYYGSGHGTHVAGTIASTKYGVAKLANVVPLRALSCLGSGQISWIVSAIEWAIADNPAGTRAVINMSLGATGTISAMDTAVKNAVADGIFVASAAGNDSKNACLTSPANSPGSFTVGAVDRFNSEAEFSNFGSCVHIYGPGVAIQSLSHRDATANSSASMSGTSQATPHVAGAAALYFSINPTATVAQAKTALLANAESGIVYGYHPSSGSPNKMLDIAWLNTSLANNSAPVLTSSTTSSSGKPVAGSTVSVTEGVWDSANPLIFSYQWYTCTAAVVSASAIPSTCSLISGETGSSIPLLDSYSGKHILVTETADNGATAKTAYSDSIGSVVVAPRVTTEPTIEGFSTGGEPITTTDGSWAGTPTPTISYQWYACSAKRATNSDSLGTGCLAIAGETQNTFTAGAAQAGKHVLVAIKATNEAVSSPVIRYTKTAAQTQTAPVNQTAPIVSISSGAASNGQPRFVNDSNRTTLTVSNGTWDVKGTYTYEWSRCDAVVSDPALNPLLCEKIANATGVDYSVTAADASKSITAKVTSTNDGGTGTKFAASTSIVGQTPSNSVAPTVTGNPDDREPLVADEGTWIAHPSAEYSYQWFSCANKVAASSSTLAAGCVTIANATSRSFQIGSAQFGKYLLSRITASNGVSDAGTSPSVYTASTMEPAATAPILVKAPTVGLAEGANYADTGAPRIFSAQSTTLKSSNGIWDSGSPTFETKWLRCDSAKEAGEVAGDDCQLIDGANGNTYTVTVDDKEKYIRSSVIATNAVGSKTAYSATTLPVTAAPINVVAPEISNNDGSFFVGTPIVVEPGTWDAYPLPTLNFAWFACDIQHLQASDTLPSDCKQITSATSDQFKPTTAQKDKWILFKVAAVNEANGTSTPAVKYSATSVNAVSAAPTMKAAPVGSNSTIKFVVAGSTLNTKLTVDPTTWGVASTYTYKWYRCDQPVESSSAPYLVGCEEIPGATTANYVVSASDVGKHISSWVTGNGNSMRTASLGVTMQAPRNTVAPSVAGSNVSVGQTVSGNTGTWLADPSADFKYQWYSCTSKVAAATTLNTACSVVAGATTNEYLIPASMNNKYLMIRVSATNATNLTTPVITYSAGSTKVLSPPTNSVAPKATAGKVTTSGEPVAGSTYTVTAGTWTGNPAPSKSYQWYSCANEVGVGVTDLPADCDLIAGATNSSLVIPENQLGRYLTAAETATNSAGSKTLYTAATNAVRVKPSFTGDPAVTGEARAGELVTADEAASSVGGDPTMSYRWANCSQANVAGAAFASNCVVISGALDKTYRVTKANEGKFLAVEVKLTNPAGTSSRVSATTSVVTGALAYTAIPKPASANGKVRVGTAVTASEGTWTGYPRPDTFTYQWYRCGELVPAESETVPANCVEISGATLQTYTPVGADAESYLSAKVKAQVGQSGDYTEAWSPSTEMVLEAPSFVSPPTVGEQNLLGGDALTSAIGVVRGTPVPSATYRWFRCIKEQVAAEVLANAADCTVVPGSVGANYNFVAADVQKYLLVEVTVKNEFGSKKWFSATSIQVHSIPKNISIAAPAAGGKVIQVGEQLTGVSGSWSGFPAPNFYYQWYRCVEEHPVATSSAPTDCAPINGSTTVNYTPSKTDSERFLSLRVRGRNDFGDSYIWSPTTPMVQEKPSFDTPLTISPEYFKDAELATYDQVRGTDLIESYQWYRCGSQVLAAPTVAPADCVVIPGAIYESYKLATADVKKYVLVEHRIKNDLGSEKQFSKSSREVLQTPEISTKLKVTGNAWNGATLTAESVAVTAYPEPQTSTAWYRCDSATTQQSKTLPGGCIAISGANSGTYVLTSADRTKYLVAGVVSSNTAGTSRLYSVSSAYIKQPPTLTQEPTITNSVIRNNAEVMFGATLTANNGTWEADPNPPTFTYQWYLCNEKVAVASDVVPTGCVAIKGETTSKYKPKATDALKFVSFSIKVSNKTVDAFRFVASTGMVYIPPSYTAGSGAKPTAPKGQAAADGSPRVGYYVEAVHGTWKGKPEANFTYQWFACDKNVKAESIDLNTDQGCQLINNANGKRFTVTQRQVDRYLGVQITGTFNTDFDEIYTPSLSLPVVSPPINIEPQVASGYPYVHATLRTTDGEWSGKPVPKQTHNWWVCNQEVVEPTTVEPVGCIAIENSSGNWKVTPEQKGKYIVSVVKSTNSAGSSSMWSQSIGPIVTGAINSVPPTLSIPKNTVTNKVPEPSMSTDINLNVGTWLGDPDPMLQNNLNQFSYFWYRCDTKVAEPSETRQGDCEQIETDAQSVFRPGLSEVGKFIMAAVTGFNDVGTSVTYTASTNIVNQVPENTQAPIVSGQAFVRKPLSVDEGVWVGVPKPAISYQWLACDSVKLTKLDSKPADCVEIKDATAKEYVATNNELGKYLIARVTGTNIAGESAVWTASTSEIVSGPVNKVEPTYIYPASKANPIVGQDLSVTDGQWYGIPAPTFTYQWYRCTTEIAAGYTAPTLLDGEVLQTPENCSAISGQTTSTYRPVEEDRQLFLTAHIHAMNGHGVADYFTKTTTAVHMAPVLETAPTVQGPIFNRSKASARGDIWKAFPAVTRSFVWYSCTTETTGPISSKPDSCSEIANATSERYSIPETLGTTHAVYLLSKITVSNAAGSAVTWTETSKQIKEGPVNTTLPVISGAEIFKRTAPTSLKATAGLWFPASVDTSKVSYQWYRCTQAVAKDSDELDASCSAIIGEDSSSYTLTVADPGKALLVAVTGGNSIGSNTIFTKSTALIGEVVNNETPPSVVGQAKVNGTVTGNLGVWNGFAKPSTVATWYLCKTAISTPKVNSIPTTCAKQSSFTGNEFKISSNMVDQYMAYSVAATNTVAGTKTTVTILSATSAKIAIYPEHKEKPTLSNTTGASDGAPVSDDILSATSYWEKTPSKETFKWYRCDMVHQTGKLRILELPADKGCAVIPGATGKTYTVGFDDSNKAIMAEVTGENAAGTATEFTNSTVLVAEVPLASEVPTVSGKRSESEILTATTGVWTSTTAPTISYRWYRCSEAIATALTQIPKTCVKIDGEQANTYVQTPSDQGEFVTAAVKGSLGNTSTTYLAASTVATAKAPENIERPDFLSMEFAVNEIFTAVEGTWDAAPAPRFEYQWYACATVTIDPVEKQPTGCISLTGETKKTYTVTQAFADDTAHPYLLVAVKAINDLGDSTWFTRSTDSAMKSSFVEEKQVSVIAENIAVTLANSGSIKVVPGTWKYGTTPYDRVLNGWAVCSNKIASVLAYIPDECDLVVNPKTAAVPFTIIFRETEYAGSYISAVEYVNDSLGKRKRVRVSISTDKILEAPSLFNDHPMFVEPSIVNDALVGISTSVKQGNWAPTGAATGVAGTTWRGVETGGPNTYQWLSCTEAVSASALDLSDSTIPTKCSAITGATASSYTPTIDVVGTYLAVQVTASNSIGSFTFRTKTSRAVTEAVNNVAGGEPTLNAFTKVGETATVSLGTWRGAPAPTFQYFWYLCDDIAIAKITATSQGAMPASCAQIPVETTSSSITIPSLKVSDVKRYIVARVRGENHPYEDQAIASVRFANVTSGRIFEAPTLKNAIRLSALGSSTLYDANVKANVGETLTYNTTPDLDWIATPMASGGVSYAYEWYSCTAVHTASTSATVPSDCTQLVGATNKFKLERVNQQQLIMARAIATNAYGVGYQMSRTTPPVREAPYVDTPAATSTADGLAPLVGQAVTATRGTWLGFPAPATYLYQWYACDKDLVIAPAIVGNDGCTKISSGTSATFTPTATQVGKRLQVSVQAINALNPDTQFAGSGFSFSATTEPVEQLPTFNASNPTITGKAHVGQTLNFDISTVSISGNPTPTSTYSWYTCSAAISAGSSVTRNTACTAIANTSGQPNLAVTSDLVNKRIAVIVTSSNSRGTTYGHSVSTPQVSSSPVNTGNPPTLTGTPLDGQTLTVTPGAWTATPTATLTYTWYTCPSAQSAASDTKASDCSVIAGATSSTYKLTRAAAGTYVIVGETATQASNNMGTLESRTATKYSSSTSIVKAAPLFTEAQLIGGNLHVGQTIQANYGKVDGVETPTIAYTWYSCSAAVLATTNVDAACSVIGSDAPLTIPETLKDKFLTYKVTATNSATTTASTTSVTKVAPNSVKVTLTPQLTTAATLTGTGAVGSTLTVSAATWNSAPAVTSVNRSYSWYACDTAKTASQQIGTDCVQLKDVNNNPITTTSLVLNSSHRGKYIVAVENVTVASNLPNAGSGQSGTASVGAVTMKPVFDANPTVSGIAHVGETLSVNPISVTGFPEPTVNYSWLACTTTQPAGAIALPGTCVEISGSADKPLVVTSAMAGKFINLMATATSSAGSTTSSSGTTADVTTGLTMVAAPSLTGGDSVGSADALTINNGTWESTPQVSASSFSYVWYLCATNPVNVPADCSVIPGETAQTLSQTSSMAGKWVAAEVTTTVRSNKSGQGKAVKYTNASARIKDLPTFVSAAPTIAGKAHVGQTLTATASGSSGYPQATSGLQWYSCTAAVTAGTSDISNSCTAIAGETATTFEITTEFTGKRITVSQKLTNEVGSRTKASATSAAVTSEPTISDDPLITGSDLYSATTSTVSVNNGVWQGFPDPNAKGSFAYQWYKCSVAEVAGNSKPTSCTAISLATANKFTLTKDVAGSYLVARVTNTVPTEIGDISKVRYSQASPLIRMAPVNATAPSMTALNGFKAKQTVTLNTGTWNAYPAANYSWQWYSCPSTVSVAANSKTVPSTCSLITGFDDNDLIIPSTLVGKKILAMVTATNSAGSTKSTTATSSTNVAASLIPLSSVRLWSWSRF